MKFNERKLQVLTSILWKWHTPKEIAKLTYNEGSEWANHYNRIKSIMSRLSRYEEPYVYRKWLLRDGAGCFIYKCSDKGKRFVARAVKEGIRFSTKDKERIDAWKKHEKEIREKKRLERQLEQKIQKEEKKLYEALKGDEI